MMTPAKGFRKLYRKVSRKIKGYFFIYSSRHVCNNSFVKFVSTISNRNFFFDKEFFSKCVGNDVYPSKAKADLLLRAEDIYKHNFDLLGSGPVNLGSKIDWHIDFKVGRRWPLSYWTRIPIYYYDGSDIKVPWELNRFHHLITLGKAYWLTKNEGYAHEFMNQVGSWIEDNPYKFGLNWVCPMEIAIRAVNWIWGWHFIKDSQTVSDEFKLNFLKCLYLHGRFIYQNLEDMEKIGGVNSNHLISNGTGLIYLGIFLRGRRESRKWLKMGLKSLLDELKNQVYPDGVDYESSISYHRLVTELFLSATLLCLKNGISFPELYMKRLEKMIEFVMYYTKPDGTGPQIGDSDDGRLHTLGSYEDWNRLSHTYLLSVGAVLFNRSDFKIAAGKFPEEAFWLLGIEGIEKYNKIQNTDSIPVGSKAFKDSGFYIMRKNNSYMLIRAGDVGMNGFGAHAHCDTLSFELFAGNKTFIVDPGTYVYTGDYEMRNLFRSSKYHNTVVVDDEEINRFKEEELFRMYNDAKPKVNIWKVTEGYDFFDGEHYGYQRLRNPVIHRRQIYFDKKECYWVIKDVLIGNGKHRYDLYFHFTPMDVGVLSCSKDIIGRVKGIRNHLIEDGFDIKESLIVETGNPEGANLLVIPVNSSGVSLEITYGWVSYNYGSKVKAPVVRYTKTSVCHQRFTTILYPF